MTLYRFDVDDPVDDSIRTNPNNYVPLFGTEENSKLQQLEAPIIDQTLSLLRPASKTRGFYLGIRDTGTCGQVYRLITYYTACQERQNELVHYRRVATPPVGGANTVFSAECESNAHNVTSLDVNVFGGNSTCRDVAVGGARCECDSGYQISEERESCVGKF